MGDEGSLPGASLPPAPAAQSQGALQRNAAPDRQPPPRSALRRPQNPPQTPIPPAWPRGAGDGCGRQRARSPRGVAAARRACQPRLLPPLQSRFQAACAAPRTNRRARNECVTRSSHKPAISIVFLQALYLLKHTWKASRCLQIPTRRSKVHGSGQPGKKANKPSAQSRTRSPSARVNRSASACNVSRLTQRPD